MYDLKDEGAIVTGATSGIGKVTRTGTGSCSIR